MNKDWRKVESKNTIWEGIKGWREFHRVQVAYNTTSPSDKDYQVGGTLMCAFNDFVFRISEQSCDKSRLERWTSLTIRGGNKLKTTFITAYCPVKGSNPGSTYSQQLVYMANHRSIIPSSIICPRQLFWT